MTVTEYCSIVDSLSIMRLSLAARGVGVAARAVEPFQHGAILARYSMRTSPCAQSRDLVPRPVDQARSQVLGIY